MTDLLGQGLEWLEGKRHAHMTTPVTYRRGGDSADLRATIGHSAFRVDVGYGVSERHESRDFLILAEHLVLGGNPTLPQRGDHIEESSGGTTYTYEVTAPKNEPFYRYCNPSRLTLRIHTKLVERT